MLTSMYIWSVKLNSLAHLCIHGILDLWESLHKWSPGHITKMATMSIYGKKKKKFKKKKTKYIGMVAILGPMFYVERAISDFK